MSQTTFVNGRGIVHQDSGGSSTVFPDVCKTPVGNSIVPIPYSNTGLSKDTTKGAKTVKTDGCMPMLKNAEYRKSTGDEPGVNGGVISGVNKSICQIVTYSFDVKFEGRNVCRLGDTMMHNKKNIIG